MSSFQTMFRFCPVCGSGDFTMNDAKSKKCGQCGFVFYFNVAAAVAAFITNEKGELLVCRRAKEPAKGTFDLPGGFVDRGENVEEALIREMKEELNIQHITSLTYLFSLPNIYQYSGLDIDTADMFFEVRVDDFSTLKADDDVEAILFLSKKDIDPAMFGLSSISKAVEKWKESNC